MSTITQSWQSIWEESIKHANICHIRSDLSEKDKLNILADVVYKNNHSKQNLEDLQKKPAFEVELNRLRRFITKDSSVLDIGAGRGRLTIPLAKEVRKLTAIEPARIYMNIMKDKAAKDGVNNIEFSEDTWADFPLQEKYDLVYSTYSAGASDPIALMKMHEASRGYCVLELGVSPPNVWDSSGKIYPMIIGEKFRLPGSYLNVITTLYDYGIYANLETWQSEKEIKYQTMKEAMEVWKIIFGDYTRINEEVEAKLRQFYRSRMNPDGSYTFNLKGAVDCMIWWHV
jgi:SAM-dependent methyltransferase